ncbi:MAG: hypothetical protein J1E62_12165 [Lachnospiraceae bacterium]|nr:hypothetical protein [Lachnospiraceae bacterium]
MRRDDFNDFYINTIKRHAQLFIEKNKGYLFHESADRIYEEYLNQKTLMRLVLEKNNANQLLDRHKVCAAMNVAILKCRPITCERINDDSGSFKLSDACTINEQLAFYSAWSLLIGFIQAANKDTEKREFVLPPTNHNDNFINTFTRSLFVANVQNSLSPELLANVYFLLESYNLK